MQLSKRTQYGLRALICLAEAYHRGFLQTRELTAREALPTKFLETILAALTRAGFLVSKIGATGGYRLARDPRQILISDVVARLEGKKIQPEHVDLEASRPPGEMGVRLVQAEMAKAMRDTLHQMTLAELTEKIGAPGRGQMYDI